MKKMHLILHWMLHFSCRFQEFRVECNLDPLEFRILKIRDSGPLRTRESEKSEGRSLSLGFRV